MRALHRGPCLAIHSQTAYELSSLPDEVTITWIGHPLRGQRLRVDRAGGFDRKHGRIIVILPDGSSTRIPVAWTDLSGDDDTSSDNKVPLKFTADGLRALMRLIELMSSRHG
jgi:Family of unknown function (DUF5372)